MRRFIILLIPLLTGIFAQTYYLEVYNPNTYDLTDFQIKLNLTQYNISAPVATIQTLDGVNVPFLL